MTLVARSVLDAFYSEDQPRDADGRFGSGGSAPGESHAFSGPFRSKDEISADRIATAQKEGMSESMARQYDAKMSSIEASLGEKFPNAQVDLGTMSSGLAEGVLLQGGQFAREFPDAAAHVDAITMEHLPDTMLAVTWNPATRDSGMSAVSFNSTWYRSEYGLKAASDAAAKPSATGKGIEADALPFHPSSDPEATAAHELGHVLDNTYQLSDGTWEGHGSFGLDMASPGAAVSGYGFGNAHENFAEAFAARQTGSFSSIPSITQNLVSSRISDAVASGPVPIPK